MKKYIKFAAFVLTGVLLAACGNKQQTEVTTSNNLFSTLLGKSEAEVQARIDSVWTHFFTPGDISKYDADGEKYWYSDPSYCLPAFLDLWAEKADAKNDFWREAADKARWLLEASQDSVTGLYPDYCLFDGKPYRRPNFDYNTDRYQYDAIRCPMNVGMDYYLTGKAKDAQRTMMRRLLTFFKNEGFKGGQFNLDGTEPTGNYTEGMAGANAVGAFALADSDSEEDRALAREYVQRLWDVQPPTGKWRYYVGMVYFLSMLHVSGHFGLSVCRDEIITCNTYF